MTESDQIEKYINKQASEDKILTQQQGTNSLAITSL